MFLETLTFIQMCEACSRSDLQDGDFVVCNIVRVLTNL